MRNEVFKIKIMTLKFKVKSALETDEQSRNSDIRLTQMVWWTYNQSKIFKHQIIKDGKTIEKPAIFISDLFGLEREDHISRVRRSIQEDAYKKVKNGYSDYKKYLPTDEKVAEQRKMNELNWAEFVGIR